MDVICDFLRKATYGGNPLGSAIGSESIKVLLEEKLTQNSKVLGEHFLKNL